MKQLEIEERNLIATLEQEYSDSILKRKQQMYKEGKRFDTCSISGYQLIIIGTTDGRWVHTFIPTLEFISALTY